MFERYLKELMSRDISRQKVSLLIGSRRVGKTELLLSILDQNKEKTLWLEGEDSTAQALLADRSIANYKRLLENYTLLIIDEAQYIPDITLKAKLMIDHIKPLHIILSGSSSFDLVQHGAPLVGRSLTFVMHSLAQIEWKQKENLLQTIQNQELRLIYGSYPELSTINSLQEKERYLKELANSYLLKDILQFENIRNTQKIKELLLLIAHQIGSEVSMHELGNQLGMSKNTVEKYMDLLTKTFVIFPLGAYSNNLRKEVSKTKKWYFKDNGIRNAIINDFSPLSIRKDIGGLWEQYLINERIKLTDARQSTPDFYFWRTYDGQEVDLLEVKDGNINAFEFKWGVKSTKTPVAFSKAYPDAQFSVINRENYLDWISPL